MLDDGGNPLVCSWSGKLCYSYNQGIETLHRMRRNPHVRGKRPTRVYLCEKCGTYHLTHGLKGGKRR